MPTRLATPSPSATSQPYVFTALLVGALAAVLGLVLSVRFSANQQAGRALVQLNDGEFRLEIADTPEERQRGLAGRSEIAPNGGMLFLFSEPGARVFWMRGMLLSIDIVWIRENRVVGIVQRAEPPASPDGTIAEFRSPEPVDTVVELRAGRSSDVGLAVGQRVQILVP